MTTLEDRFQRIFDQHMGLASCERTLESVKAAVWYEVRMLYAEGGYVLDLDDEPVRNVEDVNVVVNMGLTSLSVSVVPSVAWKRRKLEMQISLSPLPVYMGPAKNA